MLQVDLNNKILLIKYTFRFLLSSTQYIVQVVFMPLEEFNTTQLDLMLYDLTTLALEHYKHFYFSMIGNSRQD